MLLSAGTAGSSQSGYLGGGAGMQHTQQHTRLEVAGCVDQHFTVSETWLVGNAPRSGCDLVALSKAAVSQPCQSCAEQAIYLSIKVKGNELGQRLQAVHGTKDSGRSDGGHTTAGWDLQQRSGYAARTPSPALRHRLTFRM